MKYHHILFPVDFSPRSRAAAPFVLSLARRYNSRVTLLHVVELAPEFYPDTPAAIPSAADYAEIESEIKQRLTRMACAELPGVEIRCQVEFGEPGRTITQYATRAGADLIAIPTHGYGAFRRMLLGSVTASVLHDARTPVWTSAHAPEPSHRAHPQPRSILVALDCKPCNSAVLETAVELARDAGAKIEILHFAPDGEHGAEKFTSCRRQLLHEDSRERRPAELEESGVTTRMAWASDSVGAVVRRLALEKRIDLVVIGRGAIQSSGLARLKENCYSIIREAPCPVLSLGA